MVFAVDSTVGDDERAAAGLPTLACRRAEALAANRTRAAARAATPLADDEDAVRVWTPREPAALRARLDGARLAVWAEDDVLHVLWSGRAAGAQLAAGVQPQLWPVEGTDDLWEASLRVRDLDSAVVSVFAVPLTADGGFAADDGPGEVVVWRGPAAPAPPGDGPVRGTLEQRILTGPHRGRPRAVTVYRPPDVAGPLPVCVLADGETTPGFAAALEAAVAAGEVPPVLVAGVHADAGSWTQRLDGRSREYLPGADRRRFAAHLRFVVDDVLPSLGLEADLSRVVTAGFSNGAAWAVAAGQRRPDVVAGVVALSPGIVPSRVARAARGVPTYVAAGRLEPGFRRAAREWAGRLDRAGAAYRHVEWVGGHDQACWAAHLPAGLAWVLGRTG